MVIYEKTHKISNQLNSVELKKKGGSTQCICCSKHKSEIRYQHSEVSRVFVLFPQTKGLPRGWFFSLNYFFVNPSAPAGPVRTAGGFRNGLGRGTSSSTPSLAQEAAGALSQLPKYKSPNLVSELEI